jgi:hypothetical protein
MPEAATDVIGASYRPQCSASPCKTMRQADGAWGMRSIPTRDVLKYDMSTCREPPGPEHFARVGHPVHRIDEVESYVPYRTEEPFELDQSPASACSGAFYAE